MELKRVGKTVKAYFPLYPVRAQGIESGVLRETDLPHGIGLGR